MLDAKALEQPWDPFSQGLVCECLGAELKNKLPQVFLCAQGSPETLFSRECLSVDLKVSLSATHDEAWGLPSRQLFPFPRAAFLASL